MRDNSLCETGPDWKTSCFSQGVVSFEIGCEMLQCWFRKLSRWNFDVWLEKPPSATCWFSKHRHPGLSSGQIDWLFPAFFEKVAPVATIFFFGNTIYAFSVLQFSSSIICRMPHAHLTHPKIRHDFLPKDHWIGFVGIFTMKIYQNHGAFRFQFSRKP